MKKFMKKLAAGVLSLAMLLCSAVPVSAGSAEKETTSVSLDTYLNEILPSRMNQIKFARSAVNIKDEIREYVEQTLPYYLTNRQYYDTYNTSDIIQIHNWDGADEEKYLVVISKNNKMIGTLSVEYTGDNIISSFAEEYIPELNSALSKGAPFQLGYSNNCFMIYTNGKFTVIENPDNVSTNFANRITVDSNSMVVDTLNNKVKAAAMPRVSTYQTSPKCTLVTNATSPHTNDGLCWAACVASMAMQAGKASNLSAFAVYYNCINSVLSGKPSDNYPIGKNPWIKYAFKTYGMTVISKSSALSTNEVISKLSQNKPILCKIQNNTDEAGHAIVLWNCIYVNSAAAQYVFMDPGSSDNGARMISVVINSAQMADGTNITIVSRNRKTYTEWFGTLY